MKTLRFDSPPSHFIETGLKRNVSDDNKFASKIRLRKWSVFHPLSENSSHEPSAPCMFCYFKYRNQFLDYWKLCSHLQNKHDIYRNKS